MLSVRLQLLTLTTIGGAADDETDSVGLAVADCVSVPLADGVDEPEGVLLFEARTGVGEDVKDGVPVVDAVVVSEAAAVPDNDGVSVDEALEVPVSEGEAVVDGVFDSGMEMEAVGVPEPDGVPVEVNEVD